MDKFVYWLTEVLIAINPSLQQNNDMGNNVDKPVATIALLRNYQPAD